MTVQTISQADSRSSVGDQLAALIARNLRTTARVPQLLMFSLTMPLAMLVLFSQVFRSVAEGPEFPVGVSYIDFIAPAMLAVATVMAGTNVGVAAAIDHTNGLHDRFGTLAMPRLLPALARTVNQALFTVVRTVLLVDAAAVLLGFRFHGDAIDALAGFTVLIVLAAAMSALFGKIGDRLRRPDVVQFAGMMIMMPLMFVSSAFAPLDTCPDGCKQSPRPTQSPTPSMPYAARCSVPRRAETSPPPCWPRAACGFSSRLRHRGVANSRAVVYIDEHRSSGLSTLGSSVARLHPDLNGRHIVLTDFCRVDPPVTPGDSFEERLCWTRRRPLAVNAGARRATRATLMAPSR